MKRTLLFTAICLSDIGLINAGTSYVNERANATILLIRHGEKNAKSRDGEIHLNQRGEIRAAALSELFFPQADQSYAVETNISFPPLDSVVAQASTPRHPSKRKIETAEPIAKAGSLPLDLFDHQDIGGLCQHLREELDSNRTTLVVWDHSTISDIANDLLGIPRGTVRWPMDRYDVIWEIDLKEGRLLQFCQHLLFGDLWCPINPIQVYPVTSAFLRSLQQRYMPMMV
jgi:hypothetical protein